MSVSLLLSLGQPPPTNKFRLTQPFSFKNPNHNLHLSPHNCNGRSLNPNIPHGHPSLFLSSNPNPNLYNGNSNGSNNNNGGRNCWWWWSNDGDDSFEPEDNWSRLLPLILASIPLLSLPAMAVAVALSNGGVWEVRGGKWTRLIPDPTSDSFVVVDSGKDYDHGNKDSSNFYIHSLLESCWRQSRYLFLNLMLPQGYPDSVSSDYMQYSLWRALQGIASQISGVLATQSLLYAIGLGKGAIPAAAAVNWVLKDGIGYLSKILLSNFGRHFDVNPKGWRLFADLLENAAYGMEIMTPAFPQFFVLIGAAAGAGRSAATLIQAATRSCFFAGFAVQRNSAEVIAKGEAQGMVSKFIGIMLGIGLANFIGSSTPLALASFSAVTGFHMYCNLKSYQSIQLRTLNPYRASLVFSEYLLSGQVPQVKEVNDEEPLYPGLPFVNVDTYTESFGTLSSEARNAAADICSRLHLGCKLSEVARSKEEALALFDLFRNESYILTIIKGGFCVVLHEGCTPQDMLKSLFHVNYLYWLESNVEMESSGVADECRSGGRLRISLDYVRREFEHVKRDGLRNGWLTEDGLIARPLPNRIRVGYAETDVISTRSNLKFGT